MANRYYTAFSELKITGGAKYKNAAVGATPPMPEKAAFPTAKLPGKTQPRNRSLGVKKVTVYPKSMGL